VARKRTPIVDAELKSNKRIPFGPEIAQRLPCTFVYGRGWTHRRHIISQHFIREAWNTVAPRMTLPWLKELAADVVRVPERLPKDSEAMSDGLRARYFASEILRWMNDNERNLFVEDGGENSGIGAFSHAAEGLLADVLDLDWDSVAFGTAKQAVVQKLENSEGSWGTAAKEHYAWIKTVAIPLVADTTSYDQLVEALEDVQFSTDLDLDKTEDMRLKNIETLYLRAEFRRFIAGEKTQKSSFGDLVRRFVNGSSS
jgi:hypothetical protein